MRTLKLISLAGLSVLLACASDFEKQSQITKLRVLAIQAEPAELIIQDGQPPPKTTLTALAVDPNNIDVKLEWALCTVQGVVPPPSLACPGTQGIDLFAPFGSALLDLGADPFRAEYEALISGSNGEPSSQVQQALHDGVPVILGMKATSGTQALPSLTTVTLRTYDASNPINHNPAIASLEADNVTIADDGTTQIAAGTTVRLLPIPAEGAHDLDQNGAPEKLNYSFYSTTGDIQSLRSTDTTASGEAADPSIDWIAPALPGETRLWVVVRDGRGGVGWIERRVQVQ